MKRFTTIGGLLLSTLIAMPTATAQQGFRPKGPAVRPGVNVPKTPPTKSHNYIAGGGGVTQNPGGPSPWAKAPRIAGGGGVAQNPGGPSPWAGPSFPGGGVAIRPEGVGPSRPPAPQAMPGGGGVAFNPQSNNSPWAGQSVVSPWAGQSGFSTPSSFVARPPVLNPAWGQPTGQSVVRSSPIDDGGVRFQSEQGHGATTQNRRFLKLNNGTGESLTVYVRYHTMTAAGNWRWLPAGGQTLRFTLRPGQGGYLTHAGRPIHADRARVWAETEGGRSYSRFRDQDLTLLNGPYAAPEMTAFNYTLRR